MDSDNLDFYLTHWGSANLTPLLDYIRKASKAELRDLQRRIQVHAKERGERWHIVYVDTDQRSSHSLALAVVSWELRKRSKLSTWLHNTIFPIRKWWTGFWSGKDLKQTDDFGPLPIKREKGKTLFHMYGLRRWSLKIIILPVLRYLGRNVNWIVPTIVAALVAIYVAKEYGN